MATDFRPNEGKGGVKDNMQSLLQLCDKMLKKYPLTHLICHSWVRVQSFDVKMSLLFFLFLL